MSQRLLLRVLLGYASVFVGLAHLRAQFVTYTWTGKADNNSWYNDDNWAGGTAPPSSTSEIDRTTSSRIVFGNVASAHIDYGEIYVNQLKFEGTAQRIELHGSWDTTHLGSGGIVYNPTGHIDSFLLDAVQLHAAQVWDIRNGTFTIDGPISDYYYDGVSYSQGSFTIEKIGAGTLELADADSSSWLGGLTLTAGQVAIRPNDYYYYEPSATYALGSGTLTFNGGTLVARSHEYYGDGGPEVYIENDVVSNGRIAAINETGLHIGYSGEGSSNILLNADTTVDVRGQPLFLDGDISGSHSLTLDSSGILVLSGFNDYTEGTSVNQGILVFTSEGAVPDTGLLKAATNGYIGRMFDPAGTAMPIVTYLGKFDKANTSGTIGFDSNPDYDGAFNDFSEDISLNGFQANARLGSATSAILSGTITPQGTNYQFGGGGGLLIVSSVLSDIDGTHPRSVVVDSPAATPLTLGLGQLNAEIGEPLTHPGNTFTGGVTAEYSAVVFGPGAMPPTGAFTLNVGGYIGTAYTGSENFQITNVSDFISRFPTSTGQGMIGFDYFGDNQALVSSAIDLGSITGPVYLGTATAARIDGTITTTNGGSAPYRFGAYKTGQLEIASTLTDKDGSTSRGVVIGDPNSPATFGDYFEQEYATVLLSGNNTYTGGTIFWGGRLIVGQSNGVVGTNPTTALGSDGVLTVNSFPFPSDVSALFTDETPSPQLSAASEGIIIPNNLVLNTTLNIGGDYGFKLTGNISGPGRLYLEDDLCLTLSGNNTFVGGTYLSAGSSLYVNSNTGLGTGLLGFGYGYGSEVHFFSSAPVVGGLSSNAESDFSRIYTYADNAVLSINQTTDEKFQGSISNLSSANAMRIVKGGSGNLQLEYGYYGDRYVNDIYTPSDGTVESSLNDAPKVSLQINQGTLTIGSGFHFANSSTTIWVHGGSLALENNYSTLYNPLVIDNAGRLIGSGRIDSATIGSGAILSPGLAATGNIGYFEIDHLELNSGGVLEWHVGNPTGTTFVHDYINVGFEESALTLVINATSATPADKFTLKVISLDLAGTPGTLAGFDPHLGYTWVLFDYDAISFGSGGSFDPAAFSIDHSGFTNSLSFGQGNGFFSVSNDATNHQVLLNFTPVPEPSTYALLALGLSSVWLASRRRRV